MPDTHTPQQRSHNMSRIRSVGTAPERRLGELLRLMFPDEELIDHPQTLPGKPDYYLVDLHLAVFSDGCFFHKCPKHFTMPKNNRAYWEPKLARNKARDRQVNMLLRELGIMPIRIWEHNLRKDLTAARRKIRRALRQRLKPLAEECLRPDHVHCTQEPCCTC